MGEADGPDAGEIVRRYLRTRTRGGSIAALARDVRVSRPYLSRMVKGERPIPLEVAERIADALAFSLEDRAAFFRSPQVEAADALEDHYLHELERRWHEATEHAFSRITKNLVHRPPFLARWFRGRGYVARFDVRRAVPLLEAVSREVGDVSDELRAIVFLDLADAYAIAGKLDDAERQAVRSELICRRLLREQPLSPRANMGVARALVMRQEVAYERGDEATCWARHEEAVPFLRAAADHYGWSKSLFFLGLFRFWQGDLAQAGSHAKQARDHANRIGLPFDRWWALRDGFFLASHWWHVLTESLLLDVLAANGEGGSAQFDQLLLAHRGGKPFWMLDLPPFTPRYGWLDRSVEIDLERMAGTFERWATETARRQCMHLRTDILLAYGDLLKVAIHDDGGAQAIYEEAHRIASDPKHGYRLLAQAARERLGGSLPFPGLALYATR